jgi:uncharacterized membrane protein/protein-disulfide isomerase
MSADTRIYRNRHALAAVLSLAASGLAGWLGYLSAFELEIPGCGGSSGCASVMFTRWAQWFGLPIGVLAAGLYLLAAVVCLVPSGAEGGGRHRALLFASHVLAVAIGLAIAWFVGLQVLDLGSLCVYCLIDHVLGGLVACLLWRRRTTEALPTDLRPWGHWMLPTLTGVGALGGLVVGQLLGSPRDTHVVSHYTYAGGQIRITSGQAPVLGRPDASHVVLELFDYTCATCRQLAPQLKSASERYGEQLAVLLVPCPIERNCNPHLALTAVNHPEACAYARCAMAVWVAAPEEFGGFHEWLMLTDPIPPLAEARQRAQQLVGADAFQQAAGDRRVDALISRGVDLYRGIRQGVMPKLLLGDKMIQGAPQSEQQLFEVLEKGLLLKPVEPE